jgi:hypothetical protein
VAIIDDGFVLDESTGLGNADHLFNPPIQIDQVDSDHRAGGPSFTVDRWHGEHAFGVCCAAPRNRFGGAGRGGEYVRPILIRASFGWAELARAVTVASLMGADVINLGLGIDCGYLCDERDDTEPDSQLASAIANANLLGTPVLAPAKNGFDTTLDRRYVPCHVLDGHAHLFGARCERRGSG